MQFVRVAIASAVLFSALHAQEPWDYEPPADVPPPADFYKNRQSYSAIMEVLKDSRPEVTDEQLEQLRSLQLENIWGAMGDYRDTNYARGFQTTRPGERLVGRALTMRFLPPRDDLRRALAQLSKEGDWDRRFYIRAGEEAKPGDVIVAEMGGADGGIYFGDVTALGIKMRGAAGVIVDGGTRDVTELREDKFKDFPVFVRFFHIDPNRWIGTDWNVPVRVGNVAVLPGDIIVADEIGILVIPPDIVASVLERAMKQKAVEDYERDLVEQKKYRMRDVYPMHPDLRKKFEEERKSGSQP